MSVYPKFKTFADDLFDVDPEVFADESVFCGNVDCAAIEQILHRHVPAGAFAVELPDCASVLVTDEVSDCAALALGGDAEIEVAWLRHFFIFCGSRVKIPESVEGDCFAVEIGIFPCAVPGPVDPFLEIAERNGVGERHFRFGVKRAGEQRGSEGKHCAVHNVFVLFKCLVYGVPAGFVDFPEWSAQREERVILDVLRIKHGRGFDMHVEVQKVCPAEMP